MISNVPLAELQPMETVPLSGVFRLTVECNGEQRTFAAEYATKRGEPYFEITVGWLGWSPLRYNWKPIGWRPLT